MKVTALAPRNTSDEVNVLQKRQYTVTVDVRLPDRVKGAVEVWPWGVAQNKTKEIPPPP